MSRRPSCTGLAVGESEGTIAAYAGRDCAAALVGRFLHQTSKELDPTMPLNDVRWGPRRQVESRIRVGEGWRLGYRKKKVVKSWRARKKCCRSKWDAWPAFFSPGGLPSPTVLCASDPRTALASSRLLSNIIRIACRGGIRPSTDKSRTLSKGRWH